MSASTFSPFVELSIEQAEGLAGFLRDLPHGYRPNGYIRLLMDSIAAAKLGRLNDDDQRRVERMRVEAEAFKNIEGWVK